MCVPVCIRAACGFETTRVFYNVRNNEIGIEADGQQCSFGVYDTFTVFAAGRHDDPGRRGLLADVTEHARTARDATTDIAAVVVFQDDVESSADGVVLAKRLAVVGRD